SMPQGGVVEGRRTRNAAPVLLFHPTLQPDAAMYRLTILAPLFSLFCCTAEAADTSARELIWAQNNAPPFFITEGPDQGQGFGDPLQRMLEEELPDFHHITRQMPLRR